MLVRRYGYKRTARYAAADAGLCGAGAAADDRWNSRWRYEFADALDNDGFQRAGADSLCGHDCGGLRRTVDFTGTDAQTTGGVNANLAITLSASLYSFRCLVTEDVLYNAGIARAVRVIAPAGSVVNALHPSAVAGGNVETSQRITDVVLGALAQALPEVIPAASQGTMNNVTLGGTDRAEGKAFAYYETAGGGMGGRQRAGGTLGRAHAYVEHAEHAGGGVRAGVSAADPDVCAAAGQWRRGGVCRWRRAGAGVRGAGRDVGDDPDGPARGPAVRGAGGRAGGGGGTRLCGRTGRWRSCRRRRGWSCMRGTGCGLRRRVAAGMVRRDA